MKKILPILILLISSLTSVLFGQDTTPVKKDFNFVSSSSGLMRGHVKTFVPADLTRPEAGVVVTDETGKDMNFTLKSNAVIYDAVDGRLLSLKDVGPSRMAQVSYDVVGGVNIATAIRVLVSEETKAVEAPPAPVEVSKEAPVK